MKTSSSRNFRWQKVAAPAPERHEVQYLDGPKVTCYNFQCTWPKCVGKQIVGQIMYDYVTGRAGRISDARKYVCQEHLDKWRKKHPEASELAPGNYGRDYGLIG